MFFLFFSSFKSLASLHEVKKRVTHCTSFQRLPRVTVLAFARFTGSIRLQFRILIRYGTSPGPKCPEMMRWKMKKNLHLLLLHLPFFCLFLVVFFLPVVALLCSALLFSIKSRFFFLHPAMNKDEQKKQSDVSIHLLKCIRE